MKIVRISMTLAVVLGAAMATFVGCTADELPPDKPTGGSSSSGSSSGVPTNCGDGKLDMDETCDDGNNAGNDGCTQCVVDECYTCTAEAGQLSTCTFAAAATACQGTKVCNDSGACVECVDATQCGGGFCYQNACHKCDDGTKNGDETDVDCGGANCGDCADGKACGVGDDCTSTFCADSVCCAEACDGECVSCNIAGSEGVCDFVAKYTTDNSDGMGGTCDGTKVCNGSGGCSGAVGEPCTGPTQCASAKCGDPDADGMKTCVKSAGEPCTMNGECQSNVCDPGTMMCM
jgi:hypothetical protein